MATKYDIFISHASEDKHDFVKPLAAELVKRGFSVWYDDYILQVRNSIRDQIDKGISN